MIAITGAAGFIGSALAARLNEATIFRFGVSSTTSAARTKSANHAEGVTVHGKSGSLPTSLIGLLKTKARSNSSFTLGARTDTTEQNKAIFDELNEAYSQQIWNACVEYGLPLVYASSAATYGGA